MSAFLAPGFGAGYQAFNNTGAVLAGGLLYTYQSGSTLAQATWTTSTQAVQNANPIILGSQGRPANEIWLQGGSTYKFVLQDSVGNTIGTWDNVAGLNDANYAAFSEWVGYGIAPTYISPTSFSVPGNVVGTLQVGRRIQYNVLSGTYYGTFATSSYNSGTGLTTVTITPDSTAMDATLSSFSYGFMSATNSSLPITIYAPIASPTFTGIPRGPTGTAGDASTQLATQEFVMREAYSVTFPSQTGNAGKFLYTNGTIPSWAYPGITTVTAAATTDAVLSGGFAYVPITMASMGKSITLPAATGLSTGGPQFIFDNSLGAYPAGIRNNSGTLLMAVAAGGVGIVSLKDNSTAAGVWSITGTGLEPGLITIDSLLSSTYPNGNSGVFCALDANTSLHVTLLSSGFAVYLVDNTGKVLSTPLTISSTVADQIQTLFKVSSTSAIVFYSQAGSSNSRAVIVSVTGSSPSLSLSLGTPITATDAKAFTADDFMGAPRISQLTSTLYLSSYALASGAVSVQAYSVSGATITQGTVGVILAGGGGGTADSTTNYALTATTALVLYKTGAGAPWTNNAVVISVSGTTCTIGTPATSITSSTANPPSSVLVSATKCVIIDDSNTTTNVAAAISISGTTVTAGSPLTVESGAAVGSAAPPYFTNQNATRYNPHLWVATTGGTNTLGLWYLDSSGLSRIVVLSETSGTITAPGSKLYLSVSAAATTVIGAGSVKAMGTTDMLAISQEGVSTAWKKRAVPHKISGTAVTAGRSMYLNDLSGNSQANVDVAVRLSQGDYAVVSQTFIDGIPILRTNGDDINYRGTIKTPLLQLITSGQTVPVVSSNRIVLSARSQDTTINTTTYQARVLNIEVAA